MDVRNINVLVLAYLGDTIYEYYVRKYLIDKYSNVNDLQSNSIKYVRAKGEKHVVLDLIDEGFFNEEEMDVIKRARNNSSSSHPKNCDIVTYKYATGLEALIGYLELINKRSRIEEIMNKILGDK